MRELLLIETEGLTYGIWADEVRALEDLQDIHQVPLSPACVAGISIIHDRTVALADLSVCLGHGPMKRSGQGRVLFMSDQEKVTGFAVEGDITRISAQPDQVYPLPDYLKTAAIDTCVKEGSRLYPVVNIGWLYNRVQTTDQEPPIASLSVIPSSAESSVPDAVRIVEIGAERFAVPAHCAVEKAGRPGPLTRLKTVPQFVSGILFSQGRVLPVIDLMQRIFQRRSGPDALMLVADINGSAFGFLVQGDGGTFSHDVTIEPLPFIARSSWMLGAITHAGEIVPLIDLAELIAGPADETRTALVPHQYTPDSLFPVRFGKEDVEVLEISLLGIRHALPKSEVGDVLDLRPYRSIPHSPMIVVGVTEYSSKLLPVIDLAMVFGRQSLTTPEWRMVLVKNGDFSALVITEAVIGERRLTLDMQRPVPIALPHRLLYGCYPERDAVHLVLNVEAMTVHFEESMTKELMPALGINGTIAVLAPEASELFGEPTANPEGGAALARERVYEQNGIQSEPAASYTAPAAETPEVTLIDETVRIEQEAASATHELIQTKGIRTEGADIVVSQGQEEDGNNRDGALLQKHRTISSERQAPHGSALLDERTRPAEGQGTGMTSDMGLAREKIIAVEQVQPMAPVPAESKPSFLESSPVQEVARSVHEVVPPLVAKKVVKNDRKGKISTPAYESPRYQRQQQRTGFAEHIGASAVLVGSRERKRWLAGTVIGLILAALLYSTGIIGKKNALRVDRERKVETASQEKASPALKVPRGALVLDVPENTPMVVNIYIVRDGDTLWDISKRFTGNATNYPRIAGENRIADPDLIFPGQKIYLNKK